MFRFSIFACCRSLIICDSNLSSYPGFDFLSLVLKETLIFSQTNFPPAYIKSFNSVMSFVGIFVNKSFTFSVSDSTVIQSWFLREYNVVLFSDLILLMVSILVFFPLGSVFAFACLKCMSFCHVEFGYESLAFLYLSSRFFLCVSLYICWWISRISRSENQPLFVIVLTWSANLWFAALNPLNSDQISIILFLYPILAGLLLK